MWLISDPSRKNDFGASEASKLKSAVLPLGHLKMLISSNNAKITHSTLIGKYLFRYIGNSLGVFPNAQA